MLENAEADAKLAWQDLRAEVSATGLLTSNRMLKCHRNSS
jgi:hypothetical protein